ncbi:MAG: esterase [Bacilli bacterium]|nr:esterase [Bacilli bacterium]
MQLLLQGVQYQVEVDGQGSPLLVLHGFTGSSRSFASFVPKWSGQHQLIRLDLLGHGCTDAPSDPLRYSIKQAAADLIALLDELEIQQTDVLGYSMGGRLALTLALLYPGRVRRLLLESSSPGLKTAEERQDRIALDEALADRIERQGIEAFVKEWENLLLFATQKKLPADVQASVRQERLQQRPHGLAGSLRGMGTGAQPSWWQQLSEITVPVVLYAGALDEKFCLIAQEMREKLPDARVRIIPGAGHTVHLEQADIFGTMVLDDLDL